jgi:hypothetical protein
MGARHLTPVFAHPVGWSDIAAAMGIFSQSAVLNWKRMLLLSEEIWGLLTLCKEITCSKDGPGISPSATSLSKLK